MVDKSLEGGKAVGSRDVRALMVAKGVAVESDAKGERVAAAESGATVGMDVMVSKVVAAESDERADTAVSAASAEESPSVEGEPV